MTNLYAKGPLVSVNWLLDHLSDPDLVLLDASMAPVGLSSSMPHDEGGGKFIPGARVFDFDRKICDRSSPLPHMMPTAEVFEEEVHRLGVCQDSFVVVYDRQGLFSAPRAWWMFKAMGHERVAVLDGGLPAWVASGLPTRSTEAPAADKGTFTARFNPDYFCDADRVASALNDVECVVMDARSEARFRGLEAEPRLGLRSGHMPNAVNVPFTAVQKNGFYLPARDLAVIFSNRIGVAQRMIFTCGSGVTACVLALAATLAGYPLISVYDGSWSEWGRPSERPVVCD